MDDLTRSIRYPHDNAPGIGTASEVADGILWIRLPLPMALDHVNIFALDDGDSWTLIDTGIGSRACREAMQAALDGPLSGKPVSRILITHHHPDHIGLAGWFMAEHGAELVTTRTAYLTARMLSLDVQDRPSAESINFYRSAGMEPEILAKRKIERPFNFADAIAPLPLGFTRIQDGDSVTAAGRTWRVRVGHGHAPEHATLWSENDDIVLGGDQLLPSISPNLGVYPTEPSADPIGEWLASCRAFQPFATDAQLILPGHKLPFYGLPTRLDQLIENHVSALMRLEDQLADTPSTANECFKAIFKRDITGSAYGLALVEAVAHCQHLWLEGRAVRKRRDDGAFVYSTGS